MHCFFSWWNWLYECKKSLWCRCLPKACCIWVWTQLACASTTWQTTLRDRFSWRHAAALKVASNSSKRTRDRCSDCCHWQGHAVLWPLWTVIAALFWPQSKQALCCWLHHPLSNRVYYCASQERLVLSILPRFVALEMITDMSTLENELNPHEFHKIYIHQYKDVRYIQVFKSLQGVRFSWMLFILMLLMIL